MDFSNYKFLEKPVEFLNILVPSNAKWGNKLIGLDANGDPIYEQKTLDEFLSHKVISLDGTTVIFMLCAKPEVDRPRNNGVSTEDINDWIGFLANLSAITGGVWADVPSTELLDISAYKALIGSVKYAQGVV